MLKPYDRADLRFQLRERIGREGRNAEVYLAHDPQLDAELVIKKIPKRRLDEDEFFRESSLLYASAHSNIVPIHYACSDAEHVYLAMPHFSKGSLRQLMSARFLTVREIVVFSTQFLSGLHNIHSKDLVHFDVKPDNVLLSDRGEAVLSDFGLTRGLRLNRRVAQDGLYGKLVPPEAFDTDDFDNRFDIYQVGLTIYRMCVGEQAFYQQYDSYLDNGELDRRGFRHAVINGQFPIRDAAAFPEHIPDRLISTVRRCLAIEPDDRYQSVIEVVNDFADVGGELLDWQYSKGENGRSWKRTSENQEIVLSVDNEGRSTATRRTGNGNARRISAYCQPELGRQAIKRFLRSPR